MTDTWSGTNWTNLRHLIGWIAAPVSQCTMVWNVVANHTMDIYILMLLNCKVLIRKGCICSACPKCLVPLKYETTKNFLFGRFVYLSSVTHKWAKWNASIFVTLSSLSSSGPEQPPVAAAGLPTTECVCWFVWPRSPTSPCWCYLQGYHGAWRWSGTWADDCCQGGVQGTFYGDALNAFFFFFSYYKTCCAVFIRPLHPRTLVSNTSHSSIKQDK